jgi:hypothetical protein
LSFFLYLALSSRFDQLIQFTSEGDLLVPFLGQLLALKVNILKGILADLLPFYHCRHDLLFSLSLCSLLHLTQMRLLHVFSNLVDELRSLLLDF